MEFHGGRSGPQQHRDITQWRSFLSILELTKDIKWMFLVGEKVGLLSSYPTTVYAYVNKVGCYAHIFVYIFLLVSIPLSPHGVSHHVLPICYLLCKRGSFGISLSIFPNPLLAWLLLSKIQPESFFLSMAWPVCPSQNVKAGVVYVETTQRAHGTLSWKEFTVTYCNPLSLDMGFVHSSRLASDTSM
jgi:hypothetical protein